MADAGLTLDDWRERLPELVKDCVDEWELQLGEPFTGGRVGQAIPARLPDGTPAVLKLVWPHHEARYEAEALEVWGGEGAVKLLGRNNDRTALLIERCDPGAPLSTLDLDAALDIYVELLPRLWKSAGRPFQTLAAELAIDPKPLVGERDFTIAPIVRGSDAT